MHSRSNSGASGSFDLSLLTVVEDASNQDESFLSANVTQVSFDEQPIVPKQDMSRPIRFDASAPSFNPRAVSVTSESSRSVSDEDFHHLSDCRSGSSTPLFISQQSPSPEPVQTPQQRGSHQQPSARTFKARILTSEHAASRLPVFSTMQPTESVSERGSSRPSDRSSPTNSADSLTNSCDSSQPDATSSVIAQQRLIKQLAIKMLSPEEAKAASAAKNVFDIVRESCPTWRQNQTEICRSPLMLRSLAHLLHDGSERCRFEACRALGNIAFQNPGLLGQVLPAQELDATGAADALETDNCFAIVSSAGMLDGLRFALRNGNGNSKHEAARVINNCAAYSAAAAEEIVKSRELIMALMVLCGPGGRAQRTRAKAIGALNCLSTYEYLVRLRVVEGALVPALQQKKKAFNDGNEYKAMRADALMAAANLVGKAENSVVLTVPDGVKMILKCLRRGLDNQDWAGMAWSPYSSLLPLSNLCVSDSTHELLLDLGLVELLQRAIGECFNRVEQDLAIECAAHLVFSRECRKRMQSCGMSAVLQQFLLKIEHDEGEWLLRRKTQRMAWLVSRQNELPQWPLAARSQLSMTGGQVFISYFPSLQAEHMDKVRSVKEALEGVGMKICGGTSTAQSEHDMAESITKAFALVVCVCREYKESAQCRLEATFAGDMGIPIFFVLMEDSFVADRTWGWLGTLAAGNPSQCVEMRGEPLAPERHAGLAHLALVMRQLHQKRQSLLAAGQSSVAGGGKGSKTAGHAQASARPGSAAPVRREAVELEPDGSRSQRRVPVSGGSGKVDGWAAVPEDCTGSRSYRRVRNSKSG